MTTRTLTVGETLTFTFDFSPDLEIPWRPNWSVSAGEFITVGSYVYEATSAGKTSSDFPEDFPTTIGQTYDDGTVEWTVRDYSTDGSDTISSVDVSAETGVTVDSSAIAKGIHVNVTLTADSVGCHAVTCEATTAAGQTVSNVLKVLVK